MIDISFAKKSSIFDVISSHIELKQFGSYWKGCCPFHEERTGSFTVFRDTNTYKCFGCGESGDVIKFVQKIHNFTFLEALNYIKDGEFEHIEEKPKQERVYSRPDKIGNSMSHKILGYVTGRGFSPETIKHFKLYSEFKRIPPNFIYKDCLCFPYFKNNALVNIKYRSMDKEFMMHKDCELTCFNMDMANEWVTCITEGEFDVMALHESGIKNAISLPNGGGRRSNLYYLNFMHDFHKIVLILDNDNPGTIMRDAIIDKFNDRCVVAKIPSDCKDANDVLLKYGKETLREIYRNCL